MVILVFSPVESAGMKLYNLSGVLSNSPSELKQSINWLSYSKDSLNRADLYSSKVINLCNEYVQNAHIFSYGAMHAAFRVNVIPFNSRHQINCSTFSMLISFGVKLNDSKYEGGDNDGMFTNDYSESLIKWFSDGGVDDNNIKYSRDMAKKLFEDGHGKIPNEAFSNPDTGDIFFFNLDPANDSIEKQFMGVDHSAIFGYMFGDK